MIAVSLGGRIAEELRFDGLKSTGAGNDLAKCSEIARKMVCEWGMSETLGPLTYGKKDEMVFLGKEISTQKDYSEETAELIDKEVRTLVEDAIKRAMKILEENIDKLHALAAALLERELLDASEIDMILNGETLPPIISDKTPPPAAPPASPVTDESSERVSRPSGIGPEPAGAPA